MHSFKPIIGYNEIRLNKYYRLASRSTAVHVRKLRHWSILSCIGSTIAAYIMFFSTDFVIPADL